MADTSSRSAVDGRSGGKRRQPTTQWLLGDHFNMTCANQYVDDLSEPISNQNSPLPRKNLNMCFDHTAAAAGDFAATAAEVYRVECHKPDPHPEAVKYGAKAKEARNNFKHRSRNSKEPDKGSSSFADDTSLTEARHQSDDEFKGRGRDGESMRKSSHSNLDREPSGSPPRNNAEIASDHAWLDISPPRVDRTSDVNKFDPQMSNLLDAQLELVHIGKDSTSQIDTRFVRTDSKRQHKFVDGWKRQLEMTQKRLDDTFAELAQVKKEAQEKQYKATENRAHAVQDRKKLQDLYEKEVKHKRLLEENVSKLQQEVAALRISLRNARTLSPDSGPEQANSHQIISMKAEILELKLRLAEARAVASYDENATTKSLPEENELKRRLEEAEDQLSELRQKDLDLERIKQDHENRVRSLNEKIERIQLEAQTTQATLEENLKAAVQDENKVRSELTKCKSNMHRLERERSRNRLHNSADVDRLTKQLTAAKDEISKLQEEMKEEQETAKAESDKLKSELACIKENFVEVTKGLARKTSSSMAEKGKLEKQVETLTKEIETLKQVLQSKDGIIASQATQLSERLHSQVRGTEPPDATDSLQQTIDLQAALKLLQEENATLRLKISRDKSSSEKGKNDGTKGDQEENGASIVGSTMAQLSAEAENLIATLRKEIVALHGQVEFLQLKSKLHEDKILEAKLSEDQFKDEIASLRSRLSESQARCNEERLRAEEERRISRENETRHNQELDELKKDNEKIAGDKLKLREELEELRKQLAQTGKSLSISVNKASTDTPSKVNKLRNELALARARLAAARKQSGTVAIYPMLSASSSYSSEKSEETCSVSTSPPVNTVQSSTESIGSKWTPPGVSAEDFLANSPTDDMANANAHESPGKGATGSSPRSAVVQKSLIDEDENADLFSDQESLPQANEAKGGGTLGSTRVGRNVDELRRQLEESSKRLEKASNRLNGLVDQAVMKQVNVSAPTNHTIHRETISIMTEEGSESGMSEEVMTSENGDIEVQCIRYADI